MGDEYSENGGVREWMVGSQPQPQPARLRRSEARERLQDSREAPRLATRNIVVAWRVGQDERIEVTVLLSFIVNAVYLLNIAVTYFVYIFPGKGMSLERGAL